MLIRGLLILTLLATFFASGCSVRTPLAEQGMLERQQVERVTALEKLFRGLGDRVDADESKALARDSFTFAYRLSERYELVWPPLWHNTLVNVGLKERGLCYQWADDMLAHVKEGGYHSFDFYLGVSGQGTLWEHNTLVVSAKGEPFEQGVVLDPWRDSGELYFAKVSEDEKYQWQLRDG